MNSNTSNTATVNVVISGVGGQGVLTLAEILAKAALGESKNVRVGEIHGMAQRGGHVICTVRIGPDVSGPIVDPGTADILVGFEPIETLREIELISNEGSVLINSNLVYPIAVSMGKADYPTHDEIVKSIKRFTKNLIEFDAIDLAKKAGSDRAMNMVMFGAIIALGFTGISKDVAKKTIRETFPGRYEDINIRAFELGMQQIHQ